MTLPSTVNDSCTDGLNTAHDSSTDNLPQPFKQDDTDITGIVSRDSITPSASSAEQNETADDLRQSAAMMPQTMSQLKLQKFKRRNVMKWHVHHQPGGDPGTGSKHVAAYQFDVH
jgi:hypothetical protein